jgi:hypothetical protein
MNRRQYLSAMSAGWVAVLSGCGSENSQDSTPTLTDTTGTAPPTTSTTRSTTTSSEPTTTTAPAEFKILNVTAPDSVPLEVPYRVEVEVENIGGSKGVFKRNLEFMPTWWGEPDDYVSTIVELEIPPKRSFIWSSIEFSWDRPTLFYYRMADTPESQAQTVEIPGTKAPIIEETNVVSKWDDFGDVIDNAIEEVVVGAPLRIASRYWYWKENQTNNSYKQVEIFDESGNRVAIDSFESEQLTDYNGWEEWESYLSFETSGWEPGTYTAEMLIRDNQNGKVSDPGSVTFDIVRGKTTTDTLSRASIIDTEIISDQPMMASEYEKVPWFRVDVQNPNTSPHGQIQIEKRFYDTDGSVLQVRDAYSSMIPADSVWRTYHALEEGPPDALGETEVRLARVEPRFSAEELTDVEVVSNDLTIEKHSVEFTGEIRLNGEIPRRVVVVGLICDKEGVLRGTLKSVESNPSESVVFNRGLFWRRPPNESPITDHKLLVLNGHP